MTLKCSWVIIGVKLVISDGSARYVKNVKLTTLDGKLIDLNERKSALPFPRNVLSESPGKGKKVLSQNCYFYGENFVCFFRTQNSASIEILNDR